MEAQGFLTRNELSEARMYAKMSKLTEYQKKRIVKLYTKQVTGKIVQGIDANGSDFDRWVKVSVNEFRS